MEKDIKRAIYSMPCKEGVRDKQPNRYENSKEDAIIGAIDLKRNIERYTKAVEDLRSGKKDVPQVIGEFSPDALFTLVEILSQGSEKAKLAAAQDLLDRAGYSKVQKHALATVDANQSKEALLSLLMGANKDLAAEGIEIEDDRENKT